MEGTVCKSIQSPAPEFSPTKREVTSYKAIFGNVDRVREIVDRGAFAAGIGPGSLLAKGLIPTRHNHETLVGKMIHAEEDSTGLLTTDKYGSDPVSDRVFGLVRDGILTTSSFKARYPKPSRVPAKAADGQQVWHLTALTLTEAGPADPDFAVNDETRVVSVKGLQEVAGVLSNIAGLDSQEVWTMDSLDQLSPDDKAALIQILALMPKGMACDAIMAELQAEQAEEDSPDAGDMGKAIQVTELFADWKYSQLVNKLEKINRRFCTAT